MHLSQHGSRRMQQRAIPPLMVDLLLRYGREEMSNRARIVFLDAQARRRARADLKAALAHFDQLQDAYLVEANDSGTVMTVGHRTRRIRRR